MTQWHSQDFIGGGGDKCYYIGLLFKSFGYIFSQKELTILATLQENFQTCFNWVTCHFCKILRYFFWQHCRLRYELFLHKSCVETMIFALNNPNRYFLLGECIFLKFHEISHIFFGCISIYNFWLEGANGPLLPLGYTTASTNQKRLAN